MKSTKIERAFESDGVTKVQRYFNNGYETKTNFKRTKNSIQYKQNIREHNKWKYIDMIRLLWILTKKNSKLDWRLLLVNGNIVLKCRDIFMSIDVMYYKFILVSGTTILISRDTINFGCENIVSRNIILLFRLFINPTDFFLLNAYFGPWSIYAIKK